MDNHAAIARRTLLTGTLAGAAALGFPALLRGQGREVKIGHIHPLSGFLAFDGGLVTNGLTLAVEEINAAGGIRSLGGARLTLLGGDTQGKVEVGMAEAERLIHDGAVALLGPYQSPVAYAVSQLAEKERTPFVITVAVADNVTERGFEYTFRVQPNARAMTVRSLDHLADLAKATGTPVKTIAMLHEDGLFGTSIAGHVERHARALGMELVLKVGYNFRTPDVTTEITKIKAAKPDLVVVSGYFGDAILIARTATEHRLETRAVVGIANGGFSNPKFLADQPQLADLIVDGNYWHNPRSERARRVMEAYQKRFGAPMSSHSVQSYSAVMVLRDALERAGSADRAKVREALVKTNLGDHILPQGPIQFDKTGENVNAQPVLLQNQGGKTVVVGPAQFAEAKAVFPVPRWSRS
ncbi:MAG TPA: ABC transporter substrate-binding protein [Methylomirabilota bacterium]|jgi:branched-chain amino acid transport system substrate-binding protein|nr:ABC transporter substrate-binding protein [Methylomirabilota bacterium]